MTRSALVGTALVTVLAGSGGPLLAQGGGGDDGVDLGLAATLQTLTGVVDPAQETPSSGWAGIHGAVLRLKWTADWEGRAVLLVHDRVRVTQTSGDGPAAAGFGVSRRPGRAFDWTSRWIEEDRLSVVHDIDRLAVTVYTAWADVTLGRQAVSWGTALLFPVADLWAAFSPFELDLEERPGVDAARVLTYPGGVEIDGVVVDRGDGGVSGGVRASWSGTRWEAWGGAGRFWDHTLGLLGVTWLGDRMKVRGEIAAGGGTRATLGLDRISTRLSLSAEVHHNGLGARDVDGYPAALGSEALARGETYFLGRWYAGGAAAWTPDAEARLSLSLSTLVNLGDGSAAWTPAASYDLGAAARVGFGGVVSSGRAPSDGLLPSEFGAYGRQLFARVALFF